LKKEEFVAHYQSLGEKVVFIGDGNNDAEAMRIADVSIACGIVHSPAPSVMQVADYVVYDSSALVRLLNQIKSPQDGTSIVISAAGVGSRLGLGQTKSLIKINGISLIQHQLEAFADFEDVRIVIGFQASDLITEVLRHRRNLIFVFNHDYFHTKTGASLFLGAQHANASVIAWDGDLLVHPDDINTCLEPHEQYIGVSAKTSQDTVFAKVSGNSVTSFSRQDGDYEWSGPACIFRDNIKYTTENVFNQLENLLPLPLKIIRARDVDSYEDYVDAIKFVASWPAGNRNINEYYKKLSAKITLPTETRNKSGDFSQFDIQFVKKLAKPETSLLDLGSGTGLLINNLIDDFSEILAVEKYTNFSNFIKKCPKIKIHNSDILDFEIDREFDVITLFGVMNYFNKSEARKIYNKCRRWIKPDGKLVVKHQMGKTDDVIVNGYSEELQANYYSEYRWVENEIRLIESCGFSVINTTDIYPDHFNRWNNTRFFALTCSV